MKRPDFYVSGDYAGLTSMGVHFYYGYEEVINEGTEEEEWCFTAKFYDPGADDDVFIKIPSSKLGCKAAPVLGCNRD